LTQLPWATRARPDAYDTLSPDTSEVRILADVRHASMVHCTLRPGAVSAAVRHRTVEELWYFLAGTGELWRRSHGTGAEEVVRVAAGVSISLPIGTEFQFRAIVSDRLRYTDDVSKLPPATEFLKRAFAMPEVIKGIICHGMWLVAPTPELVRGRRVTCHNNLHGDVINMGAIYTDEDVVIDGDLITARTGGHCHQFARAIIDQITAKSDGAKR